MPYQSLGSAFTLVIASGIVVAVSVSIVMDDDDDDPSVGISGNDVVADVGMEKSVVVIDEGTSAGIISEDGIVIGIDWENSGTLAFPGLFLEDGRKLGFSFRISRSLFSVRWRKRFLSVE